MNYDFRRSQISRQLVRAVARVGTAKHVLTVAEVDVQVRLKQLIELDAEHGLVTLHDTTVYIPIQE